MFARLSLAITYAALWLLLIHSYRVAVPSQGNGQLPLTHFSYIKSFKTKTP